MNAYYFGCRRDGGETEIWRATMATTTHLRRQRGRPSRDKVSWGWGPRDRVGGMETSYAILVDMGWPADSAGRLAPLMYEQLLAYLPEDVLLMTTDEVWSWFRDMLEDGARAWIAGGLDAPPPNGEAPQ